MADIVDAYARSEIMSKVRSKGNNSTELRLIALFNAAAVFG